MIFSLKKLGNAFANSKAKEPFKVSETQILQELKQLYLLKKKRWSGIRMTSLF